MIWALWYLLGWFGWVFLISDISVFLEFCCILAYLFYVGGDYMAGRFLTAPLVVSLLIFGLTVAGAVRKNKNFGYYGLALGLVFLPPKLKLFSFGWVQVNHILKKAG